MTILHCYTSTRNDLYMTRHYVRHWSRYAAKIFIYDDDSTDGTAEFLDSCAPLVERKSPGFHGIDEILLQELRSSEYRKHSRGVADWVTIGDSDEFHYHTRLLDALNEKKQEGYCAVVSHGWQMCAAQPPEPGVQLTDVIKEGISDYAYNRVIFDPALDVQWGIGHHGFAIEGGPLLRFTHRAPILQPGSGSNNFHIECFDQNFKMLHYKYLGADYVRERHTRTWDRLSTRNKLQGWGHHNSPDWQGKYSPKWSEDTFNQRVKVI